MNPLLKKLLARRRLEYVTIDENFTVIETSVGVQRFADRSDILNAGHDVREFFPELFGIEELLLNVMQGKESCFELKGVGRFYQNKTIYFDLSVIEDLQEHFATRLIILFEDVTENMDATQKLVQRSNRTNLLVNQLKSSLDYIDKLIASIADALFVTNILGDIKNVNKAAQILFGYEQSELIGQPISLIVADANFFKKISTSKTKNLENIEVICQKKDGEKINVSFSFALFESEEDVYNCIYIGRDVTGRKRMEAELYQAKEKLAASSQILEEQRRQIERLGEFSYLLSSCGTLEAVYQTIARQVPPFFPEFIGSIIALDSSQRLVNAACTWGYASPHQQKQFLIHSCKALEKYPANSPPEKLVELLCHQLHPTTTPVEYLCLPNRAWDSISALFYLRAKAKGQLTEEKKRLATTIVEYIALALAGFKRSPCQGISQYPAQLKTQGGGK
ncbi:MAG TPA: PAS domain S-box protein [Oscillatoriaceae cyanobacterium M33_DOE_052]|uniref:PAS domain S-box protein n=1 Tax=Planktothricoides sp. SpSt-374 TaxID=2282167 RepID=A0A7C3ZQU3_9CYAN|nr:PAS domain S-box protein [Oscillatoriaceae cyanobacterium M33_DOE_052]